MHRDRRALLLLAPAVVVTVCGRHPGNRLGYQG
jgi:hypothetical protein